MSRITVNGQTYEVEGADIVIRNGIVTVNGKTVGHDRVAGVVQIKWEGPLANLHSDSSVSCDEVKGNVDAAGSVNCDNIGGNVSAGGSVNCDSVGGSIRAGGNVNSR